METKFIQNITPALVTSALVQAFIPVPGSPGNYQVVYAPKSSLVKDGEWTPSISATNDAVVTVNSAFYEYAGGGLCHFSMAFNVDMDPAQNSTGITISDLPIPTTFTNSRQVIAAINIGSNIAQFVSCEASSSGANILLSVNSASNGDSLQGLTLVGHYLVL